ncbi:unnamed protein product [Peronospora destructor]|uniref:Anaphase-promoting complex subunit 4 WD40 domain-containing protein n=1 Tax=Peronospora destructor TaxID=86335 RepID=A0AAV0VCY9_9STRA|nr:unnamed protein product [Peronospora destructor]
MDATGRLWKPSADDNERCRECRSLPNVKSAMWSQNGRPILLSGYDGMPCCVDAEMEVQRKSDDLMLTITCWRILASDNIQQGRASLRSAVATMRASIRHGLRSSASKGPSVGGRRPPLRFEGSHEVEGYRVRLVGFTGDAHGRVVLYRTSGKRELAESFQLYAQTTACFCAEFQSSYDESSDVLLTSSVDGRIDLFKQ